MGFRAEELPAAALRGEERLAALRRRTGSRLPGVSNEPEVRDDDASALLAAWVGASAAPLVLLLDEIQTVEPAPGRDLFDAVQRAGRRELPFLLIAAGTPDAPRRLRETATFTERALERVPVGRLSQAAAAAALAEPAAAGGRPIETAALELLLGAAQNYPYFLQLLGRAAWDHADGAPRIGLEAARRARARTAGDLDRFYAERFAEAEEHSVHHPLRALAASFRKAQGRLLRRDLERSLAGVAPGGREGDWIEVRRHLTGLGILWEQPPGSGRWGSRASPTKCWRTRRRRSPPRRGEWAEAPTAFPVTLGNPLTIRQPRRS